MLIFNAAANDGPCTEVVGIVENYRWTDLLEDGSRFMTHVNQGSDDFRFPPETLVAGTIGAVEAFLDPIRDEAAAASTQILFVNAVSMSDLLEPEVRSWRLGASMFTVFGFLALIVAGLGLYSVLAFDVALRQHELGIRSALGANVGAGSPGFFRREPSPDTHAPAVDPVRAVSHAAGCVGHRQGQRAR